mmetsp:Transcript_33749/g.82971  ORF Transcript_33749/g.82971 Transcript_33749/m.82971 type:complete len:203 (+) Transcript_33749:1645-2253(+)
MHAPAVPPKFTHALHTRHPTHAMAAHRARAYPLDPAVALHGQLSKLSKLLVGHAGLLAVLEALHLHLLHLHEAPGGVLPAGGGHGLLVDREHVERLHPIPEALHNVIMPQVLLPRLVPFLEEVLRLDVLLHEVLNRRHVLEDKRRAGVEAQLNVAKREVAQVVRGRDGRAPVQVLQVAALVRPERVHHLLAVKAEDAGVLIE